MTATLAPSRTMNDVVRDAVQRAGFRRKSDEERFLLIPDDAWRHQPAPPREPEPENEVEEYPEDYYYQEQDRKPLSRATATGLGGFAASVVSGVIPSLVVGPVAGMVAGVAAGVFGGLMGRSLAEEAYDRKHPEEGEYS